MNPTDKMEMQVEESQDGGAVVALPEGEVNPQAENLDAASGSQNNDFDDDDNDDGLDTSSKKADESGMTIEEVRNARREERRLRRKISKQKGNHLVEALKKQNADLSNRLAAVEKKTSGAELARVDKAIEDAGVQVEYAKMKMKEAVSSSDGEGLARAQELWYESKRKLESLENLKQNATQHMTQPKQNIQVPDPMVQRLAADWMEENPWYDPNGRNEESQIAQMIDKRLTEEGYDPTTEDYWDELDSRMRRYMPRQQNDNQSSQRAARPRSVMTSSGRDTTATTKSNEFRLSPDRVAAIKEAGLWNDPSARQNAIRKYAEWDRANKNRG